jgi:hypothetical protein
MSRIRSLASAAVLATAVLAGSAAFAAPLPASIGSLDRAVANNTTAVRYWHYHGHGGWGWGWGPRYGVGWGWGWPGYYTAAPYYYGPPVVYEAAPPVYYAPPPARSRSGATRQCWVDTDSSRGYGYWQPC